LSELDHGGIPFTPDRAAELKRLLPGAPMQHRATSVTGVHIRVDLIAIADLRCRFDDDPPAILKVLACLGDEPPTDLIVSSAASIFSAPSVFRVS
jgi:hypothetical protein